MNDRMSALEREIGQAEILKREWRMVFFLPVGSRQVSWGGGGFFVRPAGTPSRVQDTVLTQIFSQPAVWLLRNSQTSTWDAKFCEKVHVRLPIMAG